MSAPDIRVFDWPSQNDPPGSTQRALFNSNVLAGAGRLEGNKPFCISIDDNKYLAFKRNASAVVGGLSLDDMHALLNDISLVRGPLVAMGIRSLSLSSWNAENNLDALYQLLHQQCQIRFEFTLDTENYSINKISSNHKRNIKKSEKADAGVALPGDIEAMRNHIELVNHNLSAKGIGGITNGPEYFQFLVEQGAGVLMQVNVGGQLRASTFFYVNQDYCYYHSSGTDEAGKRIGAAHFLVDRMIAEMWKREIRYLNLGGCTSEQTGLYRFKLGFRPEARILISSKRQLVSTIKGKMRSILSIRAKDLLSTTRQQVFVKTMLEKRSGTQSNYVFKKLSFSELFDAVAANPELCQSLSEICHSGRHCYGLYDKKEQLIAFGYTQSPDGGTGMATPKEHSTSSSAAITDIYVLRDLRKKGIGTALLAYLEGEMVQLGYCQIYTRVDTGNLAAKRLFLARSFSNEGEELSVSTALMGGKKRVIGKVET